MHGAGSKEKRVTFQEPDGGSRGQVLVPEVTETGSGDSSGGVTVWDVPPLTCPPGQYSLGNVVPPDIIH